PRVRRIANPPNPWLSTHVEWLGDPPEAELEIYEESARSIISENDSPDIGFRYSINPYRGCFHGCSYCLSGDTPILMADGRMKTLATIKVGDEVFGTVRVGRYRRYVKTPVLDHWRTVKPAYRIELEDSTALVASADHRFLTSRGWKRVAPDEDGTARPRTLAANDELLGTGARAPASRKLTIDGQALKDHPSLNVVSVEPLGVALPLFDITTGTGDFIANGVVSHNCYARPTHQYLGWGAGTDFERKIVVKVNAPELLRKELSRKSWNGDTIVFSGVTDAYQPLEAVDGITRRCLETLLEFRNPVGIVTKGALIRRDRDLLAALAREASARVFVSIAFADDATARKLEPNVAPPSQRFEALAALSEAGVETGIAASPVIPGLNDSDLPKLLERAKAAGATRAFLTMLRLPSEVLPVFEERLAEAFPQRAKKIWSGIEQMRGGRRNDSRFGSRMTGTGPRWAAIERVFEVEARRLGLNAGDEGLPRSSTYRRPAPQRTLFEA
ncbi:MAG: radical SAM protein, partial [Thermoanaerobaculia bacterium]